jgi:hypothetical protein
MDESFVDPIAPETAGKNMLPMSYAEIDCINTLVQKCHNYNVSKGWWNQKTDVCRPIALIHGELSESVEALRKNLQDPHLQGRKNFDVEMADVVLRILDLCGAKKVLLGTVMSEKSIYNMTRHDHTAQARAEENGKKF